MTVLTAVELAAVRGGKPDGLGGPATEYRPKYFPENDRYLDPDIVRPTPNRDADGGAVATWDPFAAAPTQQDM